jgi:mercuric ion transport protein
MSIDSLKAELPVASAADRRGAFALFGGALAGIGASLCCLGPLALISVGVSGAWISNLTLLEPYRWILAALALGFMGYAWKRIYRPSAAQCEPGSVCALPQTKRAHRVLFWIVAALVLAALAFPYLAPLLY